MKRAIQRGLCVFGVQLLLFEAILQLSVHWRESSGELALIALGLATLPACLWIVLPLISEVRGWPSRILRALVEVTLLFVTINVADYFYSWHLRPNLGLYREPDWVQRHPGFQRELRNRIAANTWGTQPQPAP